MPLIFASTIDAFHDDLRCPDPLVLPFPSRGSNSWGRLPGENCLHLGARLKEVLLQRAAVFAEKNV
jgi:hypothetical protein